jgi:hypothetical protein
MGTSPLKRAAVENQGGRVGGGVHRLNGRCQDHGGDQEVWLTCCSRQLYETEWTLGYAWAERHCILTARRPYLQGAHAQLRKRVSTGQPLQCTASHATSACCCPVCRTGRHVTSIPLQRGTEHMAFSPRQSRLLALAESVVIPSAYRDSKSRDTTAGNVALVLLK